MANTEIEDSKASLILRMLLDKNGPSRIASEASRAFVLDPKGTEADMRRFIPGHFMPAVVGQMAHHYVLAGGTATEIRRRYKILNRHFEDHEFKLAKKALRGIADEL